MIRGSTSLVVKSLIAVMCFLALTGSVRPTDLEQTRMSGEIVMITRNSPTTYYEDRSGVTGYEYELASAFADYLGVDLKVEVADNLSDIFTKLDKGQAAFAAAGLTVTDERKRWAYFSEPYLKVSEQVIYRPWRHAPEAGNRPGEWSAGGVVGFQPLATSAKPAI